MRTSDPEPRLVLKHGKPAILNFFHTQHPLLYFKYTTKQVYISFILSKTNLPNT